MYHLAPYTDQDSITHGRRWCHSGDPF